MLVVLATSHGRQNNIYIYNKLVYECLCIRQWHGFPGVVSRSFSAAIAAAAAARDSIVCNVTWQFRIRRARQSVSTST